VVAGRRAAGLLAARAAAKTLAADYADSRFRHRHIIAGARLTRRFMNGRKRAWI
jgi:hypothetical protein